MVASSQPWRQTSFANEKTQSFTILLDSNQEEQPDLSDQEPKITNKRDDKYKNNQDDDTSIDDFLDRQFFNPDEFDENDTSLLGRFANLVKSDYALAETFYVGLIFVVMVIVSQELLRMQLYGDNYIPFTKGVAPGKLF